MTVFILFNFQTEILPADVTIKFIIMNNITITNKSVSLKLITTITKPAIITEIRISNATIKQTESETSSNVFGLLFCFVLE